MKYVKLGMTILFSLLIITACQDNGEVNGNDTVEATTPAKKHESVDLPVTIYTKEDYDMIKDMTFTRSIESVEVSDFTDRTVIEFEDIYDDIGRMNLDLINEYKRVAIQMTHSIEGDTYPVTPYEAFVLDKNSEIHFNAEPIFDEIVEHQVRKATLDYAMGRNHNEKGEIIFAIPKGYFDGNLQLKTFTKTNGEIEEVIYIDLQ